MHKKKELTNSRLKKSPTSAVVDGPPILRKTIAVGPLEPAAFCVAGGADVVARCRRWIAICCKLALLLGSFWHSCLVVIRSAIVLQLKLLKEVSCNSKCELRNSGRAFDLELVLANRRSNKPVVSAELQELLLSTWTQSSSTAIRPSSC